MGFVLQSSVVELSEQSQLEAAIQASLQDCPSPTKKTKYELIFSDSDDDGNDHTSLNSGGVSDMDETDEGCMGGTDTVDIAGDPDVLASTSFKWTVTTDPPTKLTSLTATSCDINTKPVDSHGVSIDDVKNSQPQQIRKNRKLESSPSSSQEELPRKVLRSKDSDDCYSPVMRSQRKCSKSDPVKPQSPNKSKCNVGNGTQPQATLKSDTTTLEEQVVTGAIQRDEVSYILFRLPDGSRLQKAFVCSHPIKVNLFSQVRQSHRHATVITF